MNNKYFKYWSITKPVFISNERNFYPEDPFGTIFERLKTQLYIGMNFQIIRGPESCGKTAVLRELSRQLPVAEWDILYLGTISTDIAPNTLTTKLLRFLDTTASHENPKNILEIVSSLERLSKSRRKILCLLDIHSGAEDLTKLELEIARILEVVRHHNLPLYLIAACPNGKMENIMAKSDWTGDIHPLTAEQAGAYLRWNLIDARIDPEIFTSQMISDLYLRANGSLLKLSQLAESQLIDLSLNTPEKNHSVIMPEQENTSQIQTKTEPNPKYQAINDDTRASEAAFIAVNNIERTTLLERTTHLERPLEPNTIETAKIASKSNNSDVNSNKSLRPMSQKNTPEGSKVSHKEQKRNPNELEEGGLESRKKDEKNNKKSSISLISLVSLTKDI